jgi:hypothetical protein
MLYEIDNDTDLLCSLYRICNNPALSETTLSSQKEPVMLQGWELRLHQVATRHLEMTEEMMTCMPERVEISRFLIF